MNQLILIGKVYGQINNFNQSNGEAVAKFKVSVENRQSKSTLIDCVAWKQTAVIVKQEVRSNDLVCIAGKFNPREVIQNGIPATIYEVTVDRINLILPESEITEFE